MTAGTAILEAFYQAAGQFVRPGYLAELLKATAPKVSAEIAELQKIGYDIESHPHLGYRLVGVPDRLTADDIKARLDSPRAAAKWNRNKNVAPIIGSEILVFEETSSTNDVIARMARTHPGEGLAVFAESQSRGRGRHGRAWISPRGKGLWFSVLLRPKIKPAAATRITVLASVAIAYAIRQISGVEARIKWPNDVIINGKKVAGILTELQVETDEVIAAIVGIGIDVNCLREEIPELATSLFIETGQPQDRTALAATVLSTLQNFYFAPFETVIAEWARLCVTLGRQVVVTIGDRSIEGQAQALDGDGALLLRKDNGHIERIIGADATIEK
jgi:BirA family biotin operon repressor/biotin-[acetyl-CoA-carboxylase] ligase